MSSSPLQVAVVGAGLAGLTLARELTRAGHGVKVFDKGRAPAGRMSTRHAPGASFDHGAQYFTARDPDFQREVARWMEQGVVAEWRGRFGSLEGGTVTPERDGPVRYVGVPGMSAVARRLASEVEVHSNVRVGQLRREAGAWALTADTGEVLGRFERVMLAVPAPQAVPLLAEAPALAARVAAVSMSPCWAVLAHFDAPVALPLDGVFIQDSPLYWAARDSAKPQRPEGERWVLHASADFSREHLEQSPESMVSRLLEAFSRAVGQSLRPGEAQAHRWRYARAEPPLDEGSLLDESLGLGVCGDWCAGSRVEGAYVSARHLARRLGA